MKEDAPSETALLVAKGIAFESTHPEHRHLVDPRAGELTQRFLAVAGRRVVSGASRVDRALAAIQDRIGGVHGLGLHYVLRKRRIEAIVRDAIASGFRQLVVLGGGLDTLAMRLAGEIRAIEIDHPATQKLKRAAAGDVPNLEFLAVDFTRESLLDALERSPAYRPDESAVVLAEAVFMYLPESDIRGILRQLASRRSPTRLVFTFMAFQHFIGATWVVDYWIRKIGEPICWWIDPAAIGAFVSEEGLRLIELVRDADFHEGYAAAEGEQIAVADASSGRWPEAG